MRHWNNFDIEIYDHDTVNGIETVSVRVARSPAGVQREPVFVTIPNTLRSSIKVLAKDVLSKDETILMGQELSSILLPGEARELFANSRAQLLEDMGLRIRIELRSLPLADLPWEYAYLRPVDFDNSAPERGFLGLDRALSLVRYEPVAQPPGTCKPLMGQQMQVAMLLANPDIPGWSKLDLDSEIKAVESALRDESNIQLEIHRNAGSQALNDCLDSQPHIFHFAGHGRFKMRPADQFGVSVGQGELFFEDDTGGPYPVTAQELAGKMRSSGVRLVVLNNCESSKRDSLNAFSGVAPTLVRDGAPSVVAMQFNIRDKHALVFARRLYHNLVDHLAIDEAVTAARIAMFNLNGAYTRDWGIPTLYLRSEQAVLFPDEKSYSDNNQVTNFTTLSWANIALFVVMAATIAFFYTTRIQPQFEKADFLGSVVLATLLAAGGALNYIAGDQLKKVFLKWLNRRTAAVVLVITLVFSALAFSVVPKPRIVRVVPAKDLITELKTIEDTSTEGRHYRLIVTLDKRLLTQVDFRKPGFMLMTSASLTERFRESLTLRTNNDFEEYVENLNPGNPPYIFLRFWQKTSGSREVKQLGFANRVQLRVERNGTTVSCKNVNLARLITTVFLEYKDEC